MNKRKLRLFADPHLTMNRNNGLLHTQQFRYIVRTGVKNIDGRRTLLLFFYPVKDAADGRFLPQYTVFQTKDDYLTLEQMPDGKARWRAYTTSQLKWAGYRTITSKSAFYTKQDEDRVCRFCNSESADGFMALGKMQDIIYGRKCKERKLKREKIILERMKPIGKIPAAVYQWAKNEVMPSHIFYEYRKGRKKQIGYCTHCKDKVEIVGAKHAKNGVCPRCGRNVTFHALGRHSRVYDRVTVQFLQKIGNELILRICKATMDYRDYFHPKFSFWENARTFIPIDKKGCYEPYYYSYTYIDLLTPWRRGERPVMNRFAYHYEADVCGYLYTKHLDDVLKGTPWQYSQIGPFSLAVNEPMEVLSYLRAYQSYPMLEYLVKLKLPLLASDLVYKTGDRSALNMDGKNMREILGLPPAYLSLLQESGAGLDTLKLVQELYHGQVSFSKDFIAWCRDNLIHEADALIFCRQYISEHKLMRYLQKQHDSLKKIVIPFGYYPFERLKEVFLLYKDYLKFCSDLKYDMKDDFILFPGNVKESHDRAAKMMEERKNEIYDKKISAVYKKLSKQLGMRRYGMMIVVPKSASEIVEEGHCLHHCVGGYVSRVANEECVILFLRKSKEPDKPFYTIELRDGKVAQIRGNQNCSPTAQVENYMRVWEQTKLLPAVQSAQMTA